MFDAHLHLQDPRLGGLREAVLARAVEAGVTAFCTCATSPGDWAATASLTEPAGMELHRAFGVHPWYAAGLPADWPDLLEGRLREWPGAPVGEAGLDGIRLTPPPEDQLRALVAQLEIAARLGRPVILHGARAWDALRDACRPYARRIPAFLVHAFSGSAEQLRDWLALGATISVGGGVCNPASTRIRAVAAAIPADRLVIETDTPDLLPLGGSPCREGTRLNQPSNLHLVAEALATLRGATLDEIARESTESMRRFLSPAFPNSPTSQLSN